MSVAIVGWGAVSGLGRGREAASAGVVGEPARVAIAEDDELRAAGFAKPFVARAHLEGTEGPPDRDRATRLLALSLGDCARELDAALPEWRRRRVGLCIGTSSGGMRTAELLFARVARGEPLDADFAARAAYFGPLLDVARDLGLALAPATLVLCACSSSLIAIGLGSRWLSLGKCDVVLAGGFDAVSPFVASGFESLQATSARVPPRPFRIGRDGMSLGEAAAVLGLVRSSEAGARARGYVCGFGASADAVHITAPDKTGAGLAQAARAALADAGSPHVESDRRARHRDAVQRRGRGQGGRERARGGRGGRSRYPCVQGAGGTHPGSGGGDRVARVPGWARARRVSGDGRGGGDGSRRPGADSRRSARRVLRAWP